MSERKKVTVTRRCLVCWRNLNGAFSGAHEQEFEEPPYYGVVFTAWGNYGSTVFDPGPERQMLEISVCDDCLVNRAAGVLHGEEATPDPNERVSNIKPWDGRGTR